MFSHLKIKHTKIHLHHMTLGERLGPLSARQKAGERTHLSVGRRVLQAKVYLVYF